MMSVYFLTPQLESTIEKNVKKETHLVLRSADMYHRFQKYRLIR